MNKINATAKREIKGSETKCGHSIKKGARLAMFRERALSYSDARQHNTMYPYRYVCADCVTAR